MRINQQKATLLPLPAKRVAFPNLQKSFHKRPALTEQAVWAHMLVNIPIQK